MRKGLPLMVVERPEILHNGKTGQFVMWMHYEGHNAYSVAEVAYATRPRITSDFTFHDHFRPLGIDSRDLNVYKDDDGKAHLVSSTNMYSRVRLFLLDDNYTRIISKTYCSVSSTICRAVSSQQFPAVGESIFRRRQVCICSPMA